MFRTWEELSLAKEHYTSFLIVRDPLDRLISCYRDKMVRNVIKSSKMQEKLNEKNMSSQCFYKPDSTKLRPHHQKLQTRGSKNWLSWPQDMPKKIQQVMAMS